ncbi:MAG: TrmH family RNA methyltransferase [bacterium]
MTPQALTSDQNPRVKRARKLTRRRQREKLGLFLAEGPHVVETALETGAAAEEVFCTTSFLERHAALAERLAASPWPVWVVAETTLEALADTEHSQGVAAVARLPAEAPEPRVQPGLLVLVLEGVGDPGNVGTAVRAAHAAGATMVVLGGGCCDRFNAKAVRASAGSVFAVPTRRTDATATLLRRLAEAGAQVVAAEARAERLCWEADLRGAAVLVVGSEARGLSEAVLAAAGERVRVPMPGGAESLNAAMAAGVLLYEAVRQRHGGGG